MENKYHLVTVTVTYRIDEASTLSEAIDIAREVLRPRRHYFGVSLESEVNGFCSEIIEDEETGIECKKIQDFGLQS